MTAEDFRTQSLAWVMWNRMMEHHCTKLFNDPFNIDPPPPKRPRDVINLIYWRRDWRRFLRSGGSIRMKQNPLLVEK